MSASDGLVLDDCKPVSPADANSSFSRADCPKDGSTEAAEMKGCDYRAIVIVQLGIKSDEIIIHTILTSQIILNRNPAANCFCS